MLLILVYFNVYEASIFFKKPSSGLANGGAFAIGVAGGVDPLVAEAFAELHGVVTGSVHAAAVPICVGEVFTCGQPNPVSFVTVVSSRCPPKWITCELNAFNYEIRTI